jgi:hypothetical protein
MFVFIPGRLHGRPMIERWLHGLHNPAWWLRGLLNSSCWLVGLLSILSIQGLGNKQDPAPPAQYYPSYIPAASPQQKTMLNRRKYVRTNFLFLAWKFCTAHQYTLPWAMCTNDGGSVLIISSAVGLLSSKPLLAAFHQLH